MPRSPVLLLALTLAAHAQTTPAPDASTIPAANPARPTLSVPAVLPPTGYLQLEQGFNRAVTSPSGTSAQSAVAQATKIALTSRFLVELLSAPYTFNTVFTPNTTASTSNPGDLDLGTQIVLLKSTGPRPTVDIGYLRRVRTGTAANLDFGDFSQSATLFLSGDLPHGLHYDSIYEFNEQKNLDNQSTLTAPPTHTANHLQLVKTLSLSHPVFARATAGRLGLAVELEHFTQPFVTSTAHSNPGPPRANAVDLLIATPFALRPNLVLDAAVLHGLTSTSTQWQGTFGVTWLIPHRLFPTRHS